MNDEILRLFTQSVTSERTFGYLVSYNGQMVGPYSLAVAREYRDHENNGHGFIIDDITGEIVE